MSLPTLSPLQERAVQAVRIWYSELNLVETYEGGSKISALQADNPAPVFYLGGYAGSGKSTITPVIVEALKLDVEKIAFCAPTAKAAKVMTDKLKMFGIFKRATTIHSLIYRPVTLRAEMLQKQLDIKMEERAAILNSGAPTPDSLARLEKLQEDIRIDEINVEKAYDMNEGPKFSLNVESDIRKCKLVVVDEASMVGSIIAEDLRQFGIPVLAIGDPGQLPPVQDVAGLTIGDPDFHLHEIHRQAQDNPIIRLSMQAREGENLKVGSYGDAVDVVTRLNDKATYDMSRDAQIIVGTNKTRWHTTQRMRRMMGFKSTGPEEGEVLIICKNSREKPELVNGGFVRCMKSVGDLSEGDVTFKLDIEDENDVKHSIITVQALFEEHFLKQKGAASGSKREVFNARKKHEHADWGWVITCHKSQGSQWDDVIVHDESGVFGEDAAKWIYTAITRASKRLTIVQ